MISIMGCEEGPEVDAAKHIKTAILKAWPWIEIDSNAVMYLIPNVQCHGETPRDLDLVILASLPIEKAIFHPTVKLHYINDIPVEADTVHVRTLCIILEIKDHSPRDIRFLGTKVEVRYFSAGNNERWHSASQQSEKQKYSLLNYLARQFSNKHMNMPRITNLIWLRNVSRDDLPKASHNILPSTLTWSTLLNMVATNSAVFEENEEIVLSCTPPDSNFAFSKACDLLTQRITPTNLDRRRMDRIANAEIHESWIEDLGKKQLIFKGRGGTGKTIILLALAWQLQKNKHARVLVLTYNRALVADLRRLLTLMGLSDEIGCPFIEVRTVHSFVYQLLERLELIKTDENDFLERYGDYKREILELLHVGALTQEDFHEILLSSPEDFDWDYLFVDEAQDWFTDERDILHSLYPPNHFVIADGCDQLIRRADNCDWTTGLNKVPSQIHQLNRGLRMKANLARFANNLAQEIGLSAWSIEENIDAGGGKIIIVEGDYSNAQNLHASLIESARTAGNSPVDLLTCVPPSMAENIGPKHHSITSELFQKWNYQTWDGVSEDLRRSYPISIEQLRIIQYESCRGLEGWIVFNLGLDNFYDYKILTWKQTAHPMAIAEDSQLGQRFAARWLMIPCTRAIDTLVININNSTSPLSCILKSIAERCSDFVDWVKV